MITVRGMNVFPSAIEDIIRRFEEVDEFRVELYRERGMDALRCAVEAHAGHGTGLAARVAQELHRGLGIRCEVKAVAPGSLPRHEGKARRFTRV
jgi:phenylacetate-CoA ligase